METVFFVKIVPVSDVYPTWYEANSCRNGTNSVNRYTLTEKVYFILVTVITFKTLYVEMVFDNFWINTCQYLE